MVIFFYKEKIFSNHNNISVIIGFFLGIFLLYVFLPDNNSKIIFNELALGQDNKKLSGIVDGRVVHCHDLDDFERCNKDFKKVNEKTPVILWLGNSQLHAINQAKPGDNLATAQLHKKLIKLNFYTLAFTQANANLQEHFLLFAHLLDKFPVKILILPLVFDDMREDEVRYSILDILNDAKTVKKIENSYTGKNLIISSNEKKTIRNSSEIKNNTIQNESENFLNEKVEGIWPLWKARADLRGKVFLQLYLLRNSVFGIKATTVRKVIRGPYVKNIKAYEDILNLANKNFVEVIAYIAPLRNDTQIPYDMLAYSNFKKETKILADKYNVFYSSLENIIPGKFWGYKDSTNLKKGLELDFMHFRVEGHNLLADSIFYEISSILNK